jgi:hypothetical protein
MIFNYSKFNTQVESIKNSYLKRKPYPFAYFDGLFNNQILNEINQEIDLSDFKKDTRSINDEEIKTRSDFKDNESLPPTIRKVFEIFNGGCFLSIVSNLTGINGLISDPYYDGGGVNIIKNQGTLAVHVDGTTQHRMQVCRRINVILFLNEDWNEDWNGYHEQWEYSNKNLSPFDKNQKWHCVRKILPKKNRLLLFTTNDHSWHGHAGTLNLPEGIQRRSLIAYYYTSSRPDSDLVFTHPHRALFIKNSQTLCGNPFNNVEIVL